MEWLGDQGPFEDAIAGATDQSGWCYEPSSIRCGCGEQCEWLEGEWWGCWHCDDPVPVGWEQSFGEGV